MNYFTRRGNCISRSEAEKETGGRDYEQMKSEGTYFCIRSHDEEKIRCNVCREPTQLQDLNFRPSSPFSRKLICVCFCSETSLFRSNSSSLAQNLRAKTVRHMHSQQGKKKPVTSDATVMKDQESVSQSVRGSGSEILMQGILCSIPGSRRGSIAVWTVVDTALLHSSCPPDSSLVSEEWESERK